MASRIAAPQALAALSRLRRVPRRPGSVGRRPGQTQGAAQAAGQAATDGRRAHRLSGWPADLGSLEQRATGRLPRPSHAEVSLFLSAPRAGDRTIGHHGIVASLAAPSLDALRLRSRQRRQLLAGDGRTRADHLYPGQTGRVDAPIGGDSRSLRVAQARASGRHGRRAPLHAPDRQTDSLVSRRRAAVDGDRGHHGTEDQSLAVQRSGGRRSHSLGRWRAGELRGRQRRERHFRQTRRLVPRTTASAPRRRAKSSKGSRFSTTLPTRGRIAPGSRATTASSLPRRSTFSTSPGNLPRASRSIFAIAWRFSRARPKRSGWQRSSASGQRADRWRRVNRVRAQVAAIQNPSTVF